MNWMPIETAPKDGTPIIALRLCPEPHVEGMYWADLHGVGGGMWFWTYDGDAPTKNPPTYWIPIPELPK